MAVIQLLDSVTTTGAGSVFTINPAEQSGAFTLQLIIEADTSISDFVCKLEGGLINNATYFQELEQLNYTDDLNDAGNAAMIHFEKKPVPYVRANLSTLTGTGTVSVYLCIPMVGV